MLNSYNNISDLILDKFANGKKKSNQGIVICFDKEKIHRFESRFGMTENIKIELKLRTKGDASDDGDGNGKGV